MLQYFFWSLIVFTAMHVGLIFLFLSVSRHIRALSVGDIERVLKRPSNNSGYRLPGCHIFYAVPLLLI